MADEMAHITWTRVCERDKFIMNEALLLSGPRSPYTTCREISDLSLPQWRCVWVKSSWTLSPVRGLFCHVSFLTQNPERLVS